MEDFNKPKIVWGNLNLKPSYALVNDDSFINAPSPMIVPASKYLLGVLNSNIADFYIRHLGVTRNGGYFEYKPMFVEQFPLANDKELVSRIEELVNKKQYSGIDFVLFDFYKLSKEEQEDFLQPKIVYMEIQTDNPQEGYPFPCFSFDLNKSVVLNTAYIMCSRTYDVKYILGILNSALGGFLAKLYVTQLQQRQFRMLAQYVARFPLPKCSNENMKYLSGLVEKAMTEYTPQIEAKIDDFVFELYGLDNDEITAVRNRES